MRTFIYKRTHHADPDITGRFGIYDCMGRDRAWDFEAVIGVGGLGAESMSHGLDGKVNWIGIGPHKRAAAGKRGPIVTFDHFLLLGSQGPEVETVAPQLAQRIYSKKVRVLMKGLSADEQAEVDKSLALAKGAPPSSAGNLPKADVSPRCVRLPSPKSIKGCSSRRPFALNRAIERLGLCASS